MVGTSVLVVLGGNWKTELNKNEQIWSKTTTCFTMREGISTQPFGEILLPSVTLRGHFIIIILTRIYIYIMFIYLKLPLETNILTSLIITYIHVVCR